MTVETHKCPFGAPLVTHQFGCAKAREVVRRGGAEIDCTDADAAKRCEQLFLQLKTAALPAFGVEDDLLSMPHSVLVKIQHGGLLGLQRVLAGTLVAEERVVDVSVLVRDAFVRYGQGDAIPCGECVADITGFKLRARRGR
jgi:hypothetical protein